jgi:pimeloyl-ACP methyl ester carboxylesterase
MQVALHQTNVSNVSEHQWVSADGVTMRYTKTGDGPPLLLVHGLLGGSFCWRFTVPFFARHYTVYAVDLPGSGLSDVPVDTDCSMSRQAERLSEFLDEMDLERVRVMGCSFGGAVVMLVAARDAQRAKPRILSLVLVGPVNPWSACGNGRIRFFSSAVGSWVVRLGMPVSHPVQHWAVRRMYADKRRIAPGTERGYTPMIVRPGRAQNILSTLRFWWRDLEILGAAIPHIKAPTLLVWGTQDGAVDPRSCIVLQQHLARCQIAPIEGVGHIPFEETPQQFNEIVARFLAGTQQVVPDTLD